MLRTPMHGTATGTLDSPDGGPETGLLFDEPSAPPLDPTHAPAGGIIVLQLPGAASTLLLPDTAVTLEIPEISVEIPDIGSGL